jgi:hypothetical protein
MHPIEAIRQLLTIGISVFKMHLSHQGGVYVRSKPHRCRDGKGDRLISQNVNLCLVRSVSCCSKESMEIDEELKIIRQQIDNLTKKADDLGLKLERELGTRDGGQKITAFWAAGTAVLIAAWLGATSIWQIPALVQRTAAGQAAETANAQADKAKLAADNATRDSAAIKALLDITAPVIVSSSSSNHWTITAPNLIVSSIIPNSPLQSRLRAGVC